LPRTTRGGAFRRALAAAALAAAAPAEAIETPFEAARRGARCNLEVDGSLTCRYAIGSDLVFTLRRVGEPGVALLIDRSHPEGDYIADADMIERCVFVRHGARGRAAGGSDFAYAYVSGRNGFVYGYLRQCRQVR
jgi:hypothetical protein